MQTKKSSLRSFRLNDDLLEKLRVAARREGVSENSLVEGVLSRRMKLDPIIRAFPSIVVPKETFAQIVGLTNLEGLELMGSAMGKKGFTVAKELFESHGLELEFSIYLIEILGESGWFTVEGAHVKPERMTFRHDFGLKWSLFLKSFILGAYGTEHRKGLRIDAEESYVSVRFGDETAHQRYPGDAN